MSPSHNFTGSYSADVQYSERNAQQKLCTVTERGERGILYDQTSFGQFEAGRVRAEY